MARHVPLQAVIFARRRVSILRKYRVYFAQAHVAVRRRLKSPLSASLPTRRFPKEDAEWRGVW